MALLKHSLFLQLVRKFDQSLKCEVIFRQCSSGVSTAKQQIDKQFKAINVVNKRGEKPIISETSVTHHVPSNSEIEESVERQTEPSPLFEIHRKNFYQDDNLHGFTPKVPNALDINTEDLSHLGSQIGERFNIASYADTSKTVQELTKLGVQLWTLDKHLDIVKKIVSLDFDKDVKPYIQFLHDSGVHVDHLGTFITKNPRIFVDDLDDLHTRIRYLRAHEYTPNMIATILTKHPLWLSHSTQEIDTKLGYFQHEFKLKASDVRLLTLKMPKLVSYHMLTLEKKTFAFKTEMGFSPKQTTSILMTSPRLWTRCRRNLINSFDYAHNTMGLNHEIISKQPHILNCRKSRLMSRHKFLMHLKKAQYDPSKPLYVPPKTLVTGTDSEFCENVAKVTVMTYNMFLKSL